MRKRRFTVGKIAPGTRLRVLEHLPSDRHGNQMVRVRCEETADGKECENEKAVRGTDLTRKRIKTCGCGARRANREYWQRRVDGIPLNVQRSIFAMVERGMSFAAVAERRNLQADLVMAIWRLEVHRQRPAALERTAAREAVRQRERERQQYAALPEAERRAQIARALQDAFSRYSARSTSEAHEPAIDEGWTAADDAFVEQLSEQAEQERLANELADDPAWLEDLSEASEPQAPDGEGD